MLDLQGFMRLVDATDESVAAATGLDRATVSKLRRGKQTPAARSLLAIQEWAERERVKLALPERCRLGWPGLERTGSD